MTGTAPVAAPVPDPERPLRLTVIGAGAVGGVLTALADRAGHEVSVTARGEQLTALQARGLHLSGSWGDHLAHPRASANLTEAPDLAVLTVKAQDARSALAANAHHLDGVPLVVLQNGLGGAEAAAAQLPTTPVIGALALFAASFVAPGEVAVTTPATTYLGPVAGTAPEVFDDVLATLGTFLDVQSTPNFAGAQWTKLIVNQVNALPAITGLSVQQTIADPLLRRILTASMREAVTIARASGVHFEPVYGLDDPVLTAFAAASPTTAEALPQSIATRMGPVPNPGSTLQSLLRHHLTEIDHLNGAIVTTAHTLGLNAPLNATLTALVHQAEHTGAFLTPAQIASAVGLSA
ncbi:2-dehydropantoate 2-reductase [Herbiconiux moechotypicola]|uniref:2-dehydropantoate 2-reductase n=1 Tax=Herbiconiux moechotypicola TaxID=637393 RepID=A0ABP5QE82_9MICO|nr:2-dehydropantoate 2-reductase [Herbiconiux moechotypicola]MCS5729864.1 2-dehydropantoate 2-reductase [Herbiconiux moechotypicola]